MHEGEEYVFPAPAGVILRKDVARELLRGFPRTCGGDPRQVIAAAYRGRFPRTCGGDPGNSDYNIEFDLFSPHLRG